ncbi:hypothetical protein JTE90_017185 [Oedothorax gibbosus]|uniref:Uncharacterized protein n=1 Tax=Oedothorax gibbosus TaxID=931172 RepID=A0AAV6V9L4_9ARAC|nr:hypothetical protein JTE90_017185 [Oedothorax gibbosus]
MICQARKPRTPTLNHWWKVAEKGEGRGEGVYKSSTNTRRNQEIVQENIYGDFSPKSPAVFSEANRYRRNSPRPFKMPTENQ